MAHSQQFYERLAAKLSAYVDAASAGVLLRMGMTPPFVERKPPLERYREYLAAADAGTLEAGLQERETSEPQAVAFTREDIAKLLNKYGYTGPDEEPR